MCVATQSLSLSAFWLLRTDHGGQTSWLVKHTQYVTQHPDAAGQSQLQWSL